MESAPTLKIAFHDLAPHVRLVQHIDAGESYRVPPRVIYDHELLFVLDGECEYTIEGQKLLLQPGDLLLMDPLVEHSCAARPGGRFHYYAVHFDLVPLGSPYDFSADEVYLSHDYGSEPFIAVEPDLTDRPRVQIEDFRFPRMMKTAGREGFEQLFRDLWTWFSHRPFGFDLLLRAGLLRILVHAGRELVDDQGLRLSHPQTDRVGRTVRWLQEHLAHPLQVGDLAEVAHLSEGHFRVVFKEVTGRSPSDFVVALRMDKARELLRRGGLTVTEIAEAVGYPDIHHFSRLFKRHEGLSPSRYAASTDPST